MSNDIAIQADNISKAFKLPHEKQNSLKGVVLNAFKGKRSYELQHVLNDISFTINKGEFFGIVGRNGSGKSTLLKLLAGIYTSDIGTIKVDGKLTPFIELGVGFNPELTGRENVFLNGALLGFNRKEMFLMYDEIVEFAELEKFMDQKLKNYSSGMQVRLAFSIAIQVKSDILVLDEVLAVGDEAFQRKCSDYFSRVKKDKTTIILVTHDMDSVRKYCDRALLIEQGEVSLIGSPADVANQYTLDNTKSPENRSSEKGKREHGLSDIVPEFKVELLTSTVMKSKETAKLRIKYKTTKDMPLRFGISFIDDLSGGVISVFDDQLKDEEGKQVVTSTKAGSYSFDYHIPLERFNNRDFSITATLYKVTSKSTSEVVAFTSGKNVARFLIRGEKRDNGLLKDKGTWQTK